jgi:hypothetical protein
MPIRSTKGVTTTSTAPSARGGTRKEVLDDALKNTFPASDPVSIVISEVCVWHPPSRLRGARSRHHIGSHIERLKAKAAQSVSDGKLEDEVARLKRANQELRTKNRTLTKWAEDEIARSAGQCPDRHST